MKQARKARFRIYQFPKAPHDLSGLQGVTVGADDMH